MCWTLTAAQAFLQLCGEWGLLSNCGARLLTEVISLIVEHGLQGTGFRVTTHRFSSCLSSLVVAHGLEVAPCMCGIFPDQGSNLCLLVAGRLFTTERPGSPSQVVNVISRVFYYIASFLFCLFLLCFLCLLEV